MATVRRTTTTPPSKCNCTKPQIILETDFPMEVSDLPRFLAAGMHENPRYTKIGVFYVESTDIIAIVPFGGNKLQIKCKRPDCESHIAAFEELLRGIR